MPQAWQIVHKSRTSWRDSSAIDANLHLTTIPTPDPPPPNHVLVSIRATSLNARDNMVIARDFSAYPIETAPDLVPCMDGAGEIIEIGAGSKWQIGDSVLFRPAQWRGEEVPAFVEAGGLGAGGVDGTLREVAVVDDEHLVRAPAGLSYEEAAAIGCASETAAEALFFCQNPVKAGMTVLTMGTGGVSIATIQLAVAVGATVIATTSSAEKEQYLKSLGATHTINYKEHPDWSTEVLRLTNGVGVDHVVEVGGIGTFEQSLKSTKRGGIVSFVGFLSEEVNERLGEVLTMELLLGAKTLRGVLAFRAEALDVAVALIEKHGIKPCLDKVFEWDDAKEAFKLMHAQSAIGKIVVKVGQ